MRSRAALLVVCAACSRASAVETKGVAEGSTEAATASASPSSSAEPTASESSAPPSAAPADPAPPGAAKRTTLTSLEREPLLRPQLTKLREHFAPSVVGPFLLERVDLASGRVAVLVARADETDPIVLVLDREQLLFAKERPTAGITPPVLHATIAPAPERGVAVFAYVASMHTVAARMWADDANPYADIEVFHPEACDALSVGYEAGVGWIAACSSKTGTRVQRLRENLTGAWDKEGILVGTPSPVGPPTIGFEGPSVWTLDQTAKAVGGDRKLHFRYGIDARVPPADGFTGGGH